MQSGEIYYRQLANTNKSLNKIPNLQNTQTKTKQPILRNYRSGCFVFLKQKVRLFAINYLKRHKNYDKI